MINNKTRLEIRAGERFVLHKLNGGAKALRINKGVSHTAENGSPKKVRLVGDDAVLEALQDVSVSGKQRKEFAARFVDGADAGERVVVHTNHVWPFCVYVDASPSEAEAEASRQAAMLAVVSNEQPIRRAYDESAPKRAINLSVNSDLLEQAKRLSINVSQALEARLAEMVAARVRQEWLEQNEAAIQAYNRRVEQAGVFGDDVRSF